MSETLALVFVGSSGSGASFLSRHVSATFDDFVVFRKVTTRSRRVNETDGIDYSFIDGSAFMELVRKGDLLHVKCSDWDNTLYGIERSELTLIIKSGRHPIFTSHSLEETRDLKARLDECGIATVCIYIYSTEIERKERLTKNGDGERYTSRYDLDLTFKIQAYEEGFLGCNYVIVNHYNQEVLTEIDGIVSSIRNRIIPTDNNLEKVQEEIKPDIVRLKASTAAK